MSGIGNIVANMQLNSMGFSKGLNSAAGSLGSFAGKVASIAGPIGAALAAAWGGAAAISSYKEQLKAEKKLTAVLETTGHAAGLTAGEMKTYAGELQGITNYGDEATIESMALLATFKEIKGVNFKEAIVSIQDISSVMGTDMKGATIQLGKALNDPMKGMSALAKSGVSFTEQQKAQVKAMQESGDMAGAQQVILKELKGEFGGAAQAMADPWTQAMGVVGDVGEMFGSLLLPVIDVVSSAMVWAGGKVLEYGDLFKTIGIEAAVWLEMIGGAAIHWAGAMWDFWAPLVAKLVEVFDWAWGGIKSGFQTASEIGVEALLIFQNWPTVLELAAKNATLHVVEFGLDFAYWFTDKLPAYVSWFAENWQNTIFTAVDYGLTAMINFGTNVRALWSAVVDFIAGNGFTFDWTPLTEGAVSAMSEMEAIPERAATEFETALRSDVEGLASGLVSTMDVEREKMVAGFTKSRDAISSKYDTSSGIPSAPGGPDLPGDTPAGSGKKKETAGLSEKGSAATYSTIVSAFMGKQKDPAVAAIQKQTKEIVKALNPSNEPKVIGALP